MFNWPDIWQSSQRLLLFFTCKLHGCFHRCLVVFPTPAVQTIEPSLPCSAYTLSFLNIGLSSPISGLCLEGPVLAQQRRTDFLGGMVKLPGSSDECSDSQALGSSSVTFLIPDLSLPGSESGLVFSLEYLYPFSKVLVLSLYLCYALPRNAGGFVFYFFIHLFIHSPIDRIWI